MCVCVLDGEGTRLFAFIYTYIYQRKKKTWLKIPDIYNYVCRVHVCSAVTSYLPFGRKTGSFYVLLREHRGGTNTAIRQRRKLDIGEENSPTAGSCTHSNPRPFDH